MNKQKAADINKYIRSPHTLIGAVILIGFIVNLLLVFNLVLPSFQSEYRLNQRMAQLEQQKSSLESSPVPGKASDQEIEAMVRKIPTQEELARFMLGLIELERSSGASIETITFGNEPAAADPLAALRTGTSSTPNSGTGSSLGNTNGMGQQSKVNVSDGIEESPLTLQISGTYQQTMNFMNQIYQMERFVNIKRWSVLTQSTKSTNADASSLLNKASSEDQTRDKVRLVLKLSIYTAKGYAGKFKGLPPLAAKGVDKRLDPTWNEDKFRALLQTATP